MIKEKDLYTDGNEREVLRTDLALIKKLWDRINKATKEGATIELFDNHPGRTGAFIDLNQKTQFADRNYLSTCKSVLNSFGFHARWYHKDRGKDKNQPDYTTLHKSNRPDLIFKLETTYVYVGDNRLPVIKYSAVGTRPSR